MEPQDLKLIIVQGPRSGETLEFKPGSKIRIGRVVRGNNVTVKDDGISSKHIAIESGSGKWTIEDLDSSNGTFLNSNMLAPNTPVELHDNDTVKLGDCTTISVRITMDGQDESVAKPRRNPRRQANVPGTASVRVTRGRKKAEAEPAENLGLEGGEIENQSKITKKGMGRRKNLQEMPKESREVQIESKVKLEPEELCEVQVDGKENLGLDGGEIEVQSKVTKKGRGRKKNLQEMPLESSEVQIEGKENLEPTEVCEVQVDGKENMRPDESLKNSEIQIDGKDAAKVTVAASVRVTRSRKNSSNLELECGEMVNESIDTRKGRGRKKKLQEMLPQISEVQIEGKEILEPGELCKNCEVQADAKENLGPGQESMKNCEVQVDGKENLRSEETENGGDGKESSDKVNSGVKEQVVDLEKMTLGEWFDYMEVYLRKQIMDSTEEMIEDMRRKADRVYKYMIEEKKKKKLGKL